MYTKEKIMKFCQKCGAQIDDNAVVCPHCGCQTSDLKVEKEETSTYGILAIVFGALGGWLGLVFGILGLKTYKNETYRKYCKIGIGLFVAWVVIAVIMIIVSIVTVVAAGSAIDYYSFLPL